MCGVDTRTYYRKDEKWNLIHFSKPNTNDLSKWREKSLERKSDVTLPKFLSLLSPENQALIESVTFYENTSVGKVYLKHGVTEQEGRALVKVLFRLEKTQ